jgi:predicted MFS family arabinose efflux permease
MKTQTPSLLVAYGAIHMALFPIPIITLFWKDQIGLSVASIMLLQAIFSAASVLLEFPSGYLADHFGHRVSLLVAAGLWLVGWSVYASSTTFAGVALAETLLGAGLAFASGADSALLFTSLKAEDRVTEYTLWEGRVRAASHGSEAVSSALGGYLYSVRPTLPFWLQVPGALLGLAAAWLMKQPPRSGASSRVAHLSRAWWIVRHTLVRHPRLRATVCLSAALGLSTFMMVWLIQPYMQNRGISAPWFGPLWALAHVYLAGVSLLSARMARHFGAQRVLLGCCLLIAMGYAGLALGTSPIAVVFYLCMMSIRGLQGPLLASFLQSDAPEDSRASVLSLNALVFRLGFIAIGPPLGAIVDRVGLERAMGWMGAGFTVAALLTFWMFVRAHRRNS